MQLGCEEHPITEQLGPSIWKVKGYLPPPMCPDGLFSLPSVMSMDCLFPLVADKA
jgi:hypothetical protein